MIAEVFSNLSMDDKKKVVELEQEIAQLTQLLNDKTNCLHQFQQLESSSTKTPSKSSCYSNNNENITPILSQKRKTKRKNADLFGLSKAEECPVCLNALESNGGKALFRTGCGHVFHFQCVKQCVLTSQNGCPLCRKSFKDMTPPRTPLSQRSLGNSFPGFVTASTLFNQEQQRIVEEESEDETDEVDSFELHNSTVSPSATRSLFTQERRQLLFDDEDQ